jgi:hypothetical protein
MRWLLGCLLLFCAAIAVDLAGRLGGSPPGRALLVGRIVDRDGRGLAGAQVELRGPAGAGIVRRLAASADGGFAFGDLVPGSYLLSVRNPGNGLAGAVRSIWLRPWQVETLVVSRPRLDCSRGARLNGCRRPEARTKRAARRS